MSVTRRRVNEQLLQYWQKLKGQNQLPMEAEVDPDAISDIWDSCFMVRYESEDTEQAFRYIYLGQALVEAYGDDANEKEVCEKLAYPQNHELAAQFHRVIDSQEPQMVESEFTNSKGMLIKYRSCLLPLAKDNRNSAGYIIGGMKWKAT